MSSSCVSGLVCRECSCTLDEQHFSLTCPKCGAPMRVTFVREAIAALRQGFPAFDNRSFLYQWQSILPIEDPSLIAQVSLGESESALLSSHRYKQRVGIDQLYFKLEYGSTLSLKDRGTSLCVLKAVEMGREYVCLSSSGNNAASVSAYGSRAGRVPVVLVQKNVSPSKIYKSLGYGGKVIRVDGDMAMASKLCNEMVAKHDWFQCGGPNPYRIAAKRTAFYGIVQQLGKAPDTVLIPCGGGAGMVAAFDAFSEMYEAGVIDKLPRLVGVQLEACNPTAQAFFAGKDEVTPVTKSPSLSDAIMNNNPYWGRYCLKAVRQTKGTMICISDAEFIQTIRELGRDEGLFTEPAGSASVTALRKLVKTPGFTDPGVTVCMLTGHGLNSPQVAAREDEIPEPVAPNIEAVEQALSVLLPQGHA